MAIDSPASSGGPTLQGVPARVTKYAIVGTGSRATMYIDAICGEFGSSCNLVGLCDASSVRLAYHNKRLRSLFKHDPVPEWSADKFGDMLRQAHPDVVIVTTVDAFHHVYVVEALRHGCDVIVEKPMTIDASKVGAILEAVDETQRRVTVTFNYRYSPGFSRVRELILAGAIGTPQLVDFSWMLDTSHGADYFRRWHRDRAMSGGLLVHKASHHFDLVNWWLGSLPSTVFALGELAFYGRKAAEGRGETYSYRRYAGGPDGDPFRLDLKGNEMLKGLYLEAEDETGYVRDLNVFSEGISIDDTMVLSARYGTGALLSYSLVAYSPWEGVRVSITGNKGRLELYERHSSNSIVDTAAGSGDEEADSEVKRELTLFPMFSDPVAVDLGAGKGSHGGDGFMLAELFGGSEAERSMHRASHKDGAAAALMGIAANESIARGHEVSIEEFGLDLHGAVGTGGSPTNS